MIHTLSALVENRPGVLAEVAEKFRKLGVNISSISSGETENPKISRIVLCVEAQNGDIEGLTEELSVMDFVIQIDDLARREFVDRELVLIKIAMDRENTGRLMQIFEVFRADVVGMGEETVTVELSGDRERVEGFIRMVTPFGIKSMCRSGMIALKRGDE